MLKIREMQDEILRIKKEKNICILAHAYQGREICEVADYVGDSFGLSQQAAKSEANTVIMCGVRFMAETVKILSPEKKVILSAPNAGCPMAAQMTKEDVIKLKEENPGYAVVAYINTTSDLKTVCDVCVTSSSAKKVIENMPQGDILFIPDPNLGSYIINNLPQKNIKLVNGGCPVHMRATVKDVEEAKAAHPAAKLLVHPECIREVTDMADYVGSTTGIMKYAEESADEEFIIGTENSIVEHLQYMCPDKRFYPLLKYCICENMKATTLGDVLSCLRGNGGEEIQLPDDTIKRAKACIDKMLKLGE